MYAYIKGTVTEIGGDKAVLEAAGVGYELNVSAKTAGKLQVEKTAKLYTHLHLADGIQALYGFYSVEERDMFRRLIGITRVGPKLALAVLSQMTPQEVAVAVITESAPAFDPVPGMGRKTAQRVILELKEQLKGFTLSAPAGSADTAASAVPNSIQVEAVAALTSLGYDGLTASKAVSGITDADTVELLITKALRKLAH